jgi:hypothetical protein
MKADKGQFDELLGRLLKKPPQKTADMHTKRAPKKEPKTQDRKSDH